MGTLTHTGILMSKAVLRPSDATVVKFESRIDPKQYDAPIYMGDIDYTGKWWTAQLKHGMGGFLEVNGMAHVLPNLSVGAEVFYIMQKEQRSGAGFSVRHTGDKHIGTMQVRTHCLAWSTQSGSLGTQPRAAQSLHGSGGSPVSRGMPLSLLFPENQEHVSAEARALSPCPASCFRVATPLPSTSHQSHVHEGGDNGCAIDDIPSENQRQGDGGGRSADQHELAGCRS